MKDTIQMGESAVLEFKTEDAHSNSIAKEVVAFPKFYGKKAIILILSIVRGFFHVWKFS